MAGHICVFVVLQCAVNLVGYCINMMKQIYSSVVEIVQRQIFDVRPILTAH